MEHMKQNDEPLVEKDGQDQDSLTRRDFFGLSWRLLTAFAVGQTACIGLRFLASREAEGVLGNVVIAGLVSDFPPSSITPFEQARFFLIRFEDGGFLALHSKCPHLACVVEWDSARDRFSCPCHGSEFERDGNVLNPPAPRPLDRFQVIIEGDRVKVDTRRSFHRTGPEPDAVVFAPAGIEREQIVTQPASSLTDYPSFRDPDR